MTQVMAFPFQVSPKGNIATVDDTTAAGQAQAIGVLISTRVGERVMVQSFGLTDPVFVGVSAPELTAAIAKWGPDVTVDGITIGYAADGNTQNVAVSFT